MFLFCVSCSFHAVLLLYLEEPAGRPVRYGICIVKILWLLLFYNFLFKKMLGEADQGHAS